MAMLSTAEVQSTLTRYGFVASVEYAEGVRAYIDLLLRWNRKISLTAVTEPAEIVKFHFGESLIGIRAAGISHGRLADVGSGAGFPGLPIAMALSEIDAILIESNRKKAAFLEDVKRLLALENVVVRAMRAEELPESKKFDFVLSRGLGDRQKLLEWANKRLNNDGKAALWVNSEGLDELKCTSKWRFEDAVLIPGTRERFVVAGFPVR